MTPQEAGKRLRWSARTIRRQCAAGAIPHQRIGQGPIRVSRRWVEEQERKLAA